MDTLIKDQQATASDPLLDWNLAGATAAETWELVAGELVAAAASGRHPLHLPTLTTVGADGAPQARTVVLRLFDPAHREAWFHTDVRSGKVTDMLREPRVALHWYDPTARVQIRIAARAHVHHCDARARTAWGNSAAMSRACYAACDAPGTPLEQFPTAQPHPADGDDAGFEVFTAVCCHFDTVDLLTLHAAGHQRVLLDLTGRKPTWQILAP
jgi:hypothetical protein